jgi:hypothetical protein
MKNKEGEEDFTVNKLRKYGRIFGASRQKPGFPLQSFLPFYGKKGFPLLSLAHPRANFFLNLLTGAGFPLQSRLHGAAETVFRSDQPGRMASSNPKGCCSPFRAT